MNSFTQPPSNFFSRASDNIAHFVFIHKNFIRVSHFPEDWRERYPGAKMHVLDRGRAKIISPFKRDVVSAAYHSSKFKLYGESIFSDIKQVFVDFARSVSNAASISEHLLQLVLNMQSLFESAKKAFEWTEFVFDVIQCLNNLVRLNDLFADVKNLFSLSSALVISSSIISIYKLVTHFSVLCSDKDYTVMQSLNKAMRSVKNYVFPEAGSAFESMAFVAALEFLLPKQVKGILAKMPLYTRDKLLDDSNVVSDMLAWILDIPVFLARSVGMPESMVAFLASAVSCVPCSSVYNIRKLLLADLQLFHDKASAVYDLNTQRNFLEHWRMACDWRDANLVVYDRLPQGFKSIFERCLRYVKQIEYAINTRRVEPVFYLLWGLPGTGKSNLMMMMEQRLKQNHSTYIHTTHADQKNFHDAYNGEFCYLVDDIGQRGVYQYADIINMVSSAQYTLDCAAVENKDMKRFTSRVMMATTNNIDLRITPVDPIQDLEALYRRIQLVDFSQMQFDKVTGEYKGSLAIKRRDTTKSMWVRVHTLEFTPPLGVDCEPEEYIFRQWYEVIKEDTRKRMDDYVRATAPVKGAYPSLEGEGLYERVCALASKCSDSVAFTWYSGIDMFVDFFAECIDYRVVDKWWLIFVSLFVGAMAYLGVRWRKPKVVVRKDENLNLQSKGKRKYYKSSVVDKSTRSVYRGEGDLEQYFKHANSESISPQLDVFRKNSVVVKVVEEDGADVGTSTALMSGRHFSTVRHILPSLDSKKTYYVKVYTHDKIVYDGICAKVVYMSDRDDLAIFALQRTVPILFKVIPKVTSSSNVDAFLCPPAGVVSVGKVSLADFRTSYKCASGFVGSVDENDAEYSIRGDGLCGSSLVNREGFVFGHHVAGNPALGRGYSRIFSRASFDVFKQFMFSDKGVYIPQRDEKFGNAGVVVDENVFVMNPKETTIVPSDVYEIFPVLRVPANLRPAGRDSTLEMALPAMEDTAHVDMKSLKWAKDALSALIPSDFRKVSAFEAANGVNGNGKIDLTTSAGYAFPGKKSVYFDKDEDGSLHANAQLNAAIAKLRRDIVDDVYDFKSYHKDCLKDELRNVEKKDKPRLFAAAPLDVFMLEREYLLDFIEKLHENAFQTGVMVGINPLSSEWERLLKFVTKFGDNVFDGDVSKWDKNMNPVFQRTLNELIVSKFIGSDGDKMILSQLLELLVSCPHVNTDKAYITTHSLPSGRLPTADYNSLINKLYNLYAFARLYSSVHGSLPKLSLYLNNVAFVAYGDDSLTGVSDVVKSWFNAKGVQKIFRELGMDFTPADKGEWTYVTRSVYDCTFLKRGFALHRKLGVVAPLEKLSMCSTLNFVKDEFRRSELTEIKIQNFQREAFLHADYDELMSHVSSFLKAKQMYVPLLTEDYLVSLYNSGEFFDLLELN